MIEYSVSEDDMILTMARSIETDGDNNLATIIRASEFQYEPTAIFSQDLYNQRKLYAKLQIPVEFKPIVEGKQEYLSDLAKGIYQDSPFYKFCGINVIGVLPIRTEQLEYEGKPYLLEKDSIYSNFMKFVISNPDLEEIQKKYLIEACEDGQNNNLLSATVMLGASCELLLIQLADAFRTYLVNHGERIDNYDQQVTRARIANQRLTELLKRVKTKEAVFKDFGFENIDLNFGFMDIIRMTRNDSGHPTGVTITEEQFKMHLESYQAFLPKILKAIKELPTKQ